MSNGVILTYTSLKNNLIQRAGRSDDTELLNQIDYFILFAQTELCNLLPVIPTQKIVTGQLQTGVGTVQKPANWNRTVSFEIFNPALGNLKTILEKTTPEYLSLYETEVGRMGVPKIYAELSKELFSISPSPMVLVNDQKFNFKLQYSILFEPLNDSVQTNVFTERYPSILNYACSYQMFLDLNAGDFQDRYQAALEKAVAAAVQTDQKDMSDRSQNYTLN